MELLTGKCKEKFEEWLGNQDYGMNVSYLVRAYRSKNITLLWGVLLEFADSEGYYLNTPIIDNYKSFDCYIMKGILLFELPVQKSRKEAQIEAIKEFNKLYNENK